MSDRCRFLRSTPSRVIVSGVLVAGLGLVLASVAPEAARGRPDSPTKVDPFPAKETLKYQVMVWKGFESLGAVVGTGDMILERKKIGDDEVYYISGEGRGGALGFEIHTRIKSQIERDGLAPILYDYEQGGSDPKRYKIEFGSDGAVYKKWKHCKIVEGCKDKSHINTYTERAFWIGPKRTVKEHCELDEEECSNRKHFWWQKRSTHPTEGDTYDLLTAVYMARTLGLKPGGESKTIRVVDRHDMWDVKVTPGAALETVTVPAGEREALLVSLEPAPTEGSTGVREEFRGLFGLHGALQVWCDPQTFVPVKILGVIPFGVDLNAQVELVSEERSETP